MKYEPKYEVELEALLIKLSKNKALFHEFFVDLLSPVEYRELALRWQIVKELHKGTPHREIAQNLKVSIATITRGSRELQNKDGGFARALKLK
jgi:TrpR family trp operon transcriptional repressor